jgi:hypothetical protein
LSAFDSEIEYRTTLRREGADTLNVYMCDLRGGQGLWGFAYFPSILKDWPEYDGVVISNPFTRGDDSTYVFLLRSMNSARTHSCVTTPALIAITHR